jgi:hypothetical protein
MGLRGGNEGQVTGVACAVSRSLDVKHPRSTLKVFILHKPTCHCVHDLGMEGWG